MTPCADEDDAVAAADERVTHASVTGPVPVLTETLAALGSKFEVRRNRFHDPFGHGVRADAALLAWNGEEVDLQAVVRKAAHRLYGYRAALCGCETSPATGSRAAIPDTDRSSCAPAQRRGVGRMSCSTRPKAAATPTLMTAGAADDVTDSHY